MLSSFIGIDYGAKTSGNTVICYHDGDKLFFYPSDKKDADEFIVDFVLKQQSVQVQSSLTAVFLDAPLSLPAVYHGIEGFSNYHYRACDIVLKAMSPMFLGGLTARAMELNQRLKQQTNVKTYEVYPKALAQILLPNQYHKKLSKGELEQLSILLVKNLPDLRLATLPKTQHQFDALLAWMSGFRFLNQQHLVLGHPQEGTIIV